MKMNIDYLKKWILPIEYRYQNFGGVSVYTNRSIYSPQDTNYSKNMLMDNGHKNFSEEKNEIDISGGVEDLLQDRKNLIQSKIELILFQIGHRKTINHDVIKSIGGDLCKAQTLLMGMDYKAKPMDRNILELEKIKFDLDRQVRMEQTSYFRDIGMLNKDLRDGLIQYIDHVQKDSLLSGPEVEE